MGGVLNEKNFFKIGVNLMAFFGGGGASVDLASPPAIGNTTPNTGAFTTLSFAPAANATGLSSSSYSLTGSNAQSLVSLSGTWNTTGTPTAILLNITNTASNSASRLLDLQVGGTTVFFVPRLITEDQGVLIGNSLRIGANYGNGWIKTTGNSSINIGGAANSANLNVQGGIRIGNGSEWGNAGTIFLMHDATNTLGIRNGTTAQECRFYRTFTDASNYERLSLICTRTTRFAIAAENAGTGAARSLEISFYTSASDPTSTDITSGCFSVWKNSGTGTIKLWANDGGTMKSVALA